MIISQVHMALFTEVSEGPDLACYVVLLRLAIYN